MQVKEEEEEDEECSNCGTKCRNWLILNLVVFGVIALIVWLVKEYAGDTGGSGGGGTSSSGGYKHRKKIPKSSNPSRSTGGRRRIVSKLETDYLDENVTLMENTTMRLNISLFDYFILNRKLNLTRGDRIKVNHSNGIDNNGTGSVNGENETSVDFNVEERFEINDTVFKINISDESNLTIRENNSINDKD